MHWQCIVLISKLGWKSGVSDGARLISQMTFGLMALAKISRAILLVKGLFAQSSLGLSVLGARSIGQTTLCQKVKYLAFSGGGGRDEPMMSSLLTYSCTVSCSVMNYLDQFAI